MPGLWKLSLRRIRLASPSWPGKDSRLSRRNVLVVDEGEVSLSSFSGIGEILPFVPGESFSLAMLDFDAGEMARSIELSLSHDDTSYKYETHHE